LQNIQKAKYPGLTDEVVAKCNRINKTWHTCVKKMQLRITLQRRLTFFKKWISKSLKIKMMTDTNKNL
jgi:hypothetical protein